MMAFRTCLVLLGGGFASGSVALAMDWSGPYIGVHAVRTSAQADLSTATEFVGTGYDTSAGTYFQASSVGPIAASGLGGVSPKSGSAGLTLGRNWQTGPRVTGVEVELGSMNLRGARSAGGVYPCCAPLTYQVDQSIGVDWLFTARGRVGYALNQSLVYATAGLALARVRVDARFSDNDPAARASTSLSRSQLGWALGLGYEHGFQGGWSAKAELLHLNLGCMSSTSNNLVNTAGAFPASPFTTRARLRADQLRVGFNKRW